MHFEKSIQQGEKQNYTT